jgi:hypothetical protein
MNGAVMPAATPLSLGSLACLVLLAGCTAPLPRKPGDAALDRPFIERFGVPGDMPTVDGRPGPLLAEHSPWLLFGRAAPAQPRPKPPPPIPKPLIEPVPRPPAPGLSWQPNTWEWNGHTFVWQPGRFVAVPAGLHWEYGGWTYDRFGQLIWRTGGWLAAPDPSTRQAASDLLPMNP